MKTVTADFLAAQLQPAPDHVRRVYYKRRYWDQATRGYIWESSWTELSQNDLFSISPVIWRLDTEQLTEFKVSNVTIEVANMENQWLPSNIYGLFKKDSVSPLFHYEPYFMKFQVRAGLVLADDTEELVTVFTGVATGYQFDSTSGRCQITVQGLEATLINTKAEGIATSVVQENVGTGNGATDEFTTANPGVGGVTLVSVAGLTQVEGVDFDVSQLDDETLGAKVTFVDPPDVGEVVRVSYFYWPQDQAFHDLVSLLLDVGGVDTADQLIEPVTFENSVISTRSFTSKADWDTGTLANMESTLVAGNIEPDWLDSEFMESVNWSTSLSGWTQTGTGVWTTDGTSLIGETGDYTIYRSHQRSQGSMQYTFKFNTSFSGVLGIGWRSTIAEYGDPGVTTNYGVHIQSGRFYIASRDTGISQDTSFHTVKIVQTGGITTGMRYIYFDGVLISSNSTGVGLSLPNYFYVQRNNSGVVGTMQVKDIYVRSLSVDISWTSPTIDMGSAPDSFLPLQIEDDTLAATWLYETRTGTDGIAWDSWVAVSDQNIPQSALKRYMQIRASTTIFNNIHNNSGANISSIESSWSTSGVNITLPKFAGASVYEAIQKIGGFALYEFGFTAEEDFFFRPKTVGNPVIELTQADYIQRVTGLKLGYDDVYGTVRVTYGEATREVTDDGLNPASPVARVSQRRYEFSADDSIVIPATADIATGVALSLYGTLSKPKLRGLITTKFMPQLDLSDPVTVTLTTNTPDPYWLLGDPSVNLGDSEPYLWGEIDQLVSGKKMKVIGVRYDLMSWSCELEVEEVLE